MVRVLVRGLACLACSVLIGLPASAVEAQRFICRADRAVGLGLEAEALTVLTPNVSDQLYVVSPMEVFDGRYAVMRLGEQDPLYYCDADGPDQPKMLSCGMNKLEFVINIATGRYQRLDSHGYIDDPVPPQTGPGVEVGKCFPFE